MNYLKAIPLGGFVGTFGFVVIRYGIPVEREQILAWILGLVIAISIANSYGALTALRAVRDYSLFALLFVAYDYSRGFADWFGMPLQIDMPILFDRLLFPGDVPTVELQRRLRPFLGQRWWEGAMAATYVSHFLVPYVVTGILWIRDRCLWRAWLSQFCAVTVAGLVGYVLLPTMPPWLASRTGHLDTVDRVATRGWRQFNLDIAEHLIDKGQAAVNLTAAFPSLHAAYPALIATFFWSRTNQLGRIALVGYTLAMALTLVIGGEHYVVDIVSGWIVVAVVRVVWVRFSSRSRVARWLAS